MKDGHYLINRLLFQIRLFGARFKLKDSSKPFVWNTGLDSQRKHMSGCHFCHCCDKFHCVCFPISMEQLSLLRSSAAQASKHQWGCHHTYWSVQFHRNRSACSIPVGTEFLCILAELCCFSSEIQLSLRTIEVQPNRLEQHSDISVEYFFVCLWGLTKKT